MKTLPAGECVVSIRIDRATYDELIKQATIGCRSTQMQIRMVLRQYVEGQKNPTPTKEGQL